MGKWAEVEGQRCSFLEPVIGMETRFANEGAASQVEIYSSKPRVTMTGAYSSPLVLKTGGIILLLTHTSLDLFLA